MKIGIWFRIRMAVGQMFHNKFRFTLTIAGLVLSLLLFFGGYILLDSIYESKFSSIEFWNENNLAKITLTRDDTFDIVKKQMTDTLGREYLTFERLGQGIMPHSVTSMGYQVQLLLSIFRTNENFNGTIGVDEGEIVPTSLIEGRTFSEVEFAEQQKVVVVGATLASLLFGEEALGKEIKLPYQTYEEAYGDDSIHVSTRYEKFRIVGIYDDSKIIDVDFQGEKDDRQFVAFTVFVPNTVNIGEQAVETEDNTLSNILNVYSGSEMIDALESGVKEGKVSFLYETYATKRDEIVQKYAGLRSLVNILSITILIMSAFMISQTMIFSAKERLPEFGIKRALGASETQVAMDLILEGLLYAVIAYVISLVSAVLIVLLIFYFGSSFEGLADVSLYISWKSLVLGGMMACITCFTAVICPLVYLMKKSIIETIRFE